MLGGGVGAGIGGLSGYNQWNANKTEYDDIRKKQKAWDERLAANTAETEDKMLEDSAYQSAFPEDLPENYSVNRRELENKGIVAPQRTRFDQTVTPAYKEVAQYIPYADHTLKVGSNGAQYRGYQQRLGRNMHLYWLPDEAMTTGGHELQAVARFWSRKGHLSNQLTSDPEAYTWWLDGKKISPALARAYIDNANKYATKPGLLLSEDNPTAYKHLAQMRDWLNADWWTGNAFRWGVNDYTGTAPMFGVF